MAGKLRSTKRRSAFLAACKGYQDDLASAEKYLRAGYGAAKEFFTSTVSGSPQVSRGQTGSSSVVFQQLPSVDVAIDKLRILTHALVVQEWQIYLDASFEKAITQSLAKGSVPKTQLISVDMSEIHWGKLSSIRKGLARQLRERFSFLSYDAKMGNLRKLYVFGSSDRIRVRMKTHVIVRNVFQHNRGVVRSDDLKRLGLAALVLYRKRSPPRSFKAGAPITLATNDIEELVNVAIAHSQDFEAPK